MNFFASFGAGKSVSNSGSSGQKSHNIQEQGKEWKRSLQKEIRRMDRDINNVKRAETRALNECKSLLKKGKVSSAKILAKEVAATRKTVERMHTAKAQLNSVSSNLQTQMSMMKVQGCIEKSSVIMHSMNELINVKELNEVMGSMAREMERAGLIDEIVGDALDSMEPEGLDEEADLEVEKVIAELATGVLAPAGAVPVEAIKQPGLLESASTGTETQQDAKSESNSELLSRLQAL